MRKDREMCDTISSEVEKGNQKKRNHCILPRSESFSGGSSGRHCGSVVIPGNVIFIFSPKSSRQRHAQRQPRRPPSFQEITLLSSFSPLSPLLRSRSRLSLLLLSFPSRPILHAHARFNSGYFPH